MIPGEFYIAEGDITLNALSEGREVVLEVSNTGGILLPKLECGRCGVRRINS